MSEDGTGRAWHEAVSGASMVSLTFLRSCLQNPASIPPQATNSLLSIFKNKFIVVIVKATE
jgi:hypothetical protein